MDAVSLPLRRTLALVIAAGVLAAAWWLVVLPLAEAFDRYDRSVAQSQELFERFRRLGGARAALERQLQELRRARSSAGGFLEGASPELAAAGLQNKVKTLVLASEGTLRSTQILRVKDDDEAFRQVGVRVTMMATTEAMSEIFYALETENPYLFLDNIDIRVRRARSGAKRTGDQGILQIRFNVYGYMRVEAS